jgi:asparaginyl-tRNA synthetase
MPFDHVQLTTVRNLLDRHPDWAVCVRGWIRTSRFSKNVTFLHVYDGSTEQTLQVVLTPPAGDELRARLGVGAAVEVEGFLVASKGAEQAYELKADAEDVLVVGDCDPSEYPIQKKEASPEFLRTIPHLRVRTAEFQRIFIARNTVSAAIHGFFQGRGFMWVHAPIITGSDCEGAGEMFHVATVSEGKVAKMAMGMGARPVLADDEFFGKSAFLTVSGQLDLEPFAMAFSKVYTFGPTFRAENSNTSRHAAEFWMIEPEIAFAEVDDVMDLAEAMVRTAVSSLGSTAVVSLPPPEQEFARMTFAEALDVLKASGRTFEHPVGWEHPLQTEHERYIAEEVVRGPVFVTHYPVQHKSFYMLLDNGCEPDRQTVACFDLLVPGVGEIVGGSAREYRLDKLLGQMARCGLDPTPYAQYLDLRRFGSVPHGGFGLGLERLLMWALGVSNIRDVLPYPRTPGSIG